MVVLLLLDANLTGYLFICSILVERVLLEVLTLGVRLVEEVALVVDSALKQL